MYGDRINCFPELRRMLEAMPKLRVLELATAQQDPLPLIPDIVAATPALVHLLLRSHAYTQVEADVSNPSRYFGCLASQ